VEAKLREHCSIPVMGIYISSEENSSLVDIDVLVHPSGPSVESFLVCFKHLELWMHIVAFLEKVSSVRPPKMTCFLHQIKG
jgi:hypothetical protein